ncbi:MAG: PBP1A family penicillin-binding protein [Acidobacteriota bacterium]|nr:PBP1A family penicillin-binding protein [Blastocatellia bacterium]MDW8412162.1 PBP1A family penicillin-binding protein [Acidobacteriota bacterium]
MRKEAGKPQPASQNLIQKAFYKSTFLALWLLSVVLGVATGLTISYQAELMDEAKQVLQLANYKPSLVSQVIADDGKTVIGEFAFERRIPLSYDEIPERMKQAIIAIEDSRFESHWGIDPIGILRAGWRNFQAGATVEGGSTLTQQLAKMLFLTPEKTFTRKAKEALLAIQIERYFSKQQIMEMYCNQIFLGGGAYGVEAGAEYYFGKKLSELSLEEYALLAAIPKAPSYYSPIRNPKNARLRRDLVLENMAQEGFITRKECEEAKSKPIKLRLQSRDVNTNSPYAYFVEEVRQYMEDSYGTRKLHTSGLKIYTTLNVEAQRHAVQDVKRGLHEYDRRHPKWRGNLPNVIEDEQVKDLDSYHLPDWDHSLTEGAYVQGLVMQVTDKAAQVRFRDYMATVTAKEAALSRKSILETFKRGDLPIFYIKKLDHEKKQAFVVLEQLPAVNGAFVCIDVKTGEVKVMVGGYDFKYSKFNNATQANRQTGSVFKPFIYAAAIENGWTVDDYVADTPFVQGDWMPKNYDGKFMGVISLKTALAQSRNIPAVRLLQSVGVQKGAELVKRFGIKNPMAPYLPSALGATEVPLIELVSAYGVFANEGVLVEPHIIRKVVDYEGKVLEEFTPRSRQVISPYVAASMVTLMRGVVENGTAARIKSVTEGDLAKREIAGKTGTVNDFTDAWFIGYTPSVVAGFWIGYPGEKRSLGEGETGAQAALPVWISFMKYYLNGKPIEKFPKMPEPDSALKKLQAQRAKQILEELKTAMPEIDPSMLPLPPSLRPQDSDDPAEDGESEHRRQDLY